MIEILRCGLVCFRFVAREALPVTRDVCPGSGLARRPRERELSWLLAPVAA